MTVSSHGTMSLLVSSLSLRLFVCFMLLLAGNLRQTHGAICEEIRIPMCNWLPYNLTRMPNLLFHSAQTNAELVLDQYKQLVDTGCSDDLLFFLCAMFAPMCPMGFRQDVIPPCQGVCMRARRGCEPKMNQYNVSWPQELACEPLPKYDRGVCISPESIITTATTGAATPRVPEQPQTQTERPRCECQQRTQQKLKRAFTSGQYHYAMRAEYRQTELLPDGARILHVIPRYVFYQRRVRIRRGVTRLWINQDCLCTKLKEGKQYLFMGKERRSLGRLLLSDNSYIAKWREKTAKRLQSWNQKLAKARYKRRHVSRRKNSKENVASHHAHASTRRKSRDRHRQTSRRPV